MGSVILDQGEYNCVIEIHVQLFWTRVSIFAGTGKRTLAPKLDSKYHSGVNKSMVRSFELSLPSTFTL